MTNKPFHLAEWVTSHHGDATLLGICPMTPEIVRAALREAANKRFPPMFIATPRQVDADRGYTGWSQQSLTDHIETVASDVGYDGPYILARDHGGPYQSFRDRDDSSIPLSTAMDYARELFVADQHAGFDVLHVDATEDPSRSSTLGLAEIADRTSRLISDIESHNDKNTRPPLYEVGTEEITGGMTQPEDFGRFLELLREGLEDEAPDASDRLLFAVGQIGTTMRIDMENGFDNEQTAELVDVAADHDVYLKTHYTDWLDTHSIERFPNLGVSAANVGPEFSAALITALLELDEREHECAATSDGSRSEFSSILKQTAIDEAPWQKFAPDDLSGVRRQNFLSNHRRNIALCVGRYVLGEPDVVAAREQLYENVRSHTDIDPEAFILERIQESIHRYVEAFDLSNTLEV